MLGGLGVTELIIILVIVLIIFGAGKLPKIAKSIGEGIKEFKKATKEKESKEEKEEKKEKPPQGTGK
ncbi:MAG: twin-arginine translocase TatA/TatE family subunit [bacterium]